MDEAAYQGDKFFYQAMVPVAGRNYSSIVIITTPKTENNYVSRLVEVQEKDRELINVLHIGGPCDECKKSPNPGACTHQDLPPNKSQKRLSRMAKHLYQGRQDAFERENFATITGSGNKSFGAVAIKALFASTPMPLREPPRIVYMFIDPSGGGESDIGICVHYFDQGMVVLFMDSINVKNHPPQTDRDLFRNIIWKIRNLRPKRGAPDALPPFRSALFVVGAEAAPVRTPVDLENSLRKKQRELGTIITMREIGSGKSNDDRCFGLPKTDKTTRDMMVSTRSMLESRSIRFSEDFFTYRDITNEERFTDYWTTNGGTRILGNDHEHVRELLKACLFEHQFVKEEGKQNGYFTAKKGNLQDDMLVAFMMGTYWPTVFQSSSYKPYRDAIAAASRVDQQYTYGR